MRRLLVIPALAVAVSAAVVDRVAVVVGRTVITETEVLQEARIAAFLNQAPLDLGPAARRAAAERLVDQQLIRNEMQIGGYPQPSAAEIDSMLANLKQERLPSDAQYRAALDRYGIKEEDLRRHLAWQLSAIRFTDVRFTATVQNEGQSANRDKPATNGVDEQMEAWLKETRSTTRIQFKTGAFQ